MKFDELIDSQNVFIVAELSANHNGSLETAIETIRAAKRSGADAIKLQTYTANTMTLDINNKDFVINNGSIWDGDNLYKLYQQAHTPWEWHETLFNVAKEEGLVCFSTPFDFTSVDFLESLNNPIYKVASFEITDLPLIEYIAKKGKPIILSTGIATKEEIDDAINTITATSNNEIALLKCTSSYPAPPEEANLVMIQEYKKKYNVIPGLSDHTLGNTIPVVATALGAKIIEKHFILDKTIGGPDASFSLDEKEFKEMVEAVRIAEKGIGEVSFNLTEKQKNGRFFSRSLIVTKDVKKGDELSSDNIRSLRPGIGISPKHYTSVIGGKFKKDYTIGTPLNHDMIANE